MSEQQRLEWRPIFADIIYKHFHPYGLDALGKVHEPVFGLGACFAEDEKIGLVIATVYETALKGQVWEFVHRSGNVVTWPETFATAEEAKLHLERYLPRWLHRVNGLSAKSETGWITEPGWRIDDLKVAHVCEPNLPPVLAVLDQEQDRLVCPRCEAIFEGDKYRVWDIETQADGHGSCVKLTERGF